MRASEPIEARTAADLPLAVDLDGTLIRGDLFFEAILRFVFSAPWRLPELLWWFRRGRAYVKQRLAAAQSFDAALLAYDGRVLDWLHQQRARGRTIVLATASDHVAAQKVADHVGVFDAVFASDGETNLKSARKAERLAAAFPEGFVYAGNESADVKVWRVAARAVLCNCDAGLSARAARDFTVEHTFARQGGAWLSFVSALRPQQWAKNLLVFVPMLAGQGWANASAWTLAFIAFWALSLTASAVYLLNDAADIDADRRHPRKRNRPFASGALSPAWGLAGAFVLLAGGLALGAAANVLALLLAYVAVTGAYTLWLKRLALIDVFVLAGLYTLRVIIGGVATNYFASDWLLAFSCFFFLSLALVKRAAETRDLALRGGGSLDRRGYVSGDTPMLTMMGLSAGFVAALVLSLYLQDESVAAHYRAPLWLWALPAACVLLLSRMWLKVGRGEMHDDPIVFALRDPASWAVVLGAAACFAAAALG